MKDLIPFEPPLGRLLNHLPEMGPKYDNAGPPMVEAACACYGRRWLLSERMDTGKVEVQRCDLCTDDLDDIQAGQLALQWFAKLHDLF